MRNTIYVVFVFIAGLSSFPASLRASTPIQLRIQDPVDSIFANDTFTLSAKIFDRNNVEARQFQDDSLDTCFKWILIDPLFGNVEKTFIDSTGPLATCRANPWPFWLQISCSFWYQNSYFANDTVKISIYHRDTFSLFIEGTMQRETSPLRPLPIDTIRIGAAFTDTTHVYAIIRDKYGNYVYPSQNILWFASSPVFQINGGNDSLGEALIFSESHSTGTGMIWCVDTLHHLSDSAVVAVYGTSGSVRDSPFNFFPPPSTIASFFDIRGRRVAATHSTGVYIRQNGTLQAQLKIIMP